MVLLIPLLTMVCLTAVLSSILVLSHHWLRVDEDPRIDAVEAMLPATNCGGCGYPGCRPFAEALVAGEVSPAQCTVSASSVWEQIAQYLGVALGKQERWIARLACAGGTNVARNHARYQGRQTCASAAVVAGGGKGCFWGCLGYADCVHACTFDAIRMDAHDLPVVDEQLCTGCGDCVVACPKDLFSLHAESNRLWVACRSLEAGDQLLSDCQVACTACGRCAMDAPEAIHMDGNLPVIDYSRGPVNDAGTQNCPTGAIVWLDPSGPVKGPAATKIVRQETIRDAPT